MTENSSYLIGKLGKPHGLQGYQYINIDKYFRDINMNDVSVVVDDRSFQIEDFKSHLKDRNLIKFKPIKGADHFYESYSQEFEDSIHEYIHQTIETN